MNINESSMVGAELLVPCCCESNARLCPITGCQSALAATVMLGKQEGLAACKDTSKQGVAQEPKEGSK